MTMTIEKGFVHRTIADQIQIAVLKERQRCADIAALYPVFAYDGDTGELLRVRDLISEAILQCKLPGEMVS